MIFAISMVKDEADIIGGMIDHLAEEVDHILIADNDSTDGTTELLYERAGDDLTLVHDLEPAYYQSDKMTALAEQAHEMGATWIVPVDADELWFYRGNRIKQILERMKPEVNIANATLYNHFPSAIDPEGDPFESIVWRQIKQGAMPKVAFRWESGAVIGQGNHSVRLLSGSRYAPINLELRHFPYRSEEQFIRKARNGAAAYKATDLPESWGAHWRSYGEILERHGEEALAEVFRTHFYFTSPIDNEMIHDPAPYKRWVVDDSSDIVP